MITVSFHHLATQELYDSRDYYDSIYNGLGKSFIIEVESTIRRIKLLPLSFPILRIKIRKAILKKFPYSILFRVDQEEIFILAIMHQKRNPNYWIE